MDNAAPAQTLVQSLTHSLNQSLGVASDDDGLTFVMGQQRALRLCDAERIAFARLEGAPEGSLREALATTIVEDAPAGQGPQQTLGQRLQDVAAADEAAFLRPFQAVPLSGYGWSDAVPPAHTVPFFEAPDSGPDAIPSSAEVIPAFAVPPLPAAAAAIPPPAILEAPLFETDMSSLVDQELALSLMEVEPQAIALELPGDGQGHMPEPTVMPAETMPLLRSDDPKLEPIVTAFAASARLAADATAASQALQHLKRLLAEQLLEEQGGGAAGPLPRAEIMHQAHDATHGVAGEREADPCVGPVGDQPPPLPILGSPTPPMPGGPPPIPVVAPVSAAPGSAMPVSVEPLSEGPSGPASQTPPAAMPALPLDVPPEPLPQIMSKARVSEKAPRQPTAPVIPPVPPVARNREDARGSKPKAPGGPRPSRALTRQPPENLPALVPTPAELPRAAFDLRGFCAGFVLSGAIGLVLYFVMAAG